MANIKWRRKDTDELKREIERYNRKLRDMSKKGFESEDGASLRAAGWEYELTTKGGDWSCPSRRRNSTAPTVPKKKFCKYLSERSKE